MPDILDCNLPDPIFVQEIKAGRVLAPDAAVAPAEIWDWCESRLAAFKVPRYLEFRDALPLTGSGRVRKQVLREHVLTTTLHVHDRRNGMA